MALADLAFTRINLAASAGGEAELTSQVEKLNLRQKIFRQQQDRDPRWLCVRYAILVSRVPRKVGGGGPWLSESLNRQRPPKPLDHAAVPGAERLANKPAYGHRRQASPSGPRKNQ
jgi:hypothetical protein